MVAVSTFSTGKVLLAYMRHTSHCVASLRALWPAPTKHRLPYIRRLLCVAHQPAGTLRDSCWRKGNRGRGPVSGITCVYDSYSCSYGACDGDALWGRHSLLLLVLGMIVLLLCLTVLVNLTACRAQCLLWVRNDSSSDEGTLS